MKRWMILLGIVLVVVVIIGAGYLGSRGSPSASREAGVAPPTVPVDRGDVIQTITAPGQLVSTRDLTVSAAVGGTLSEVLVHPGQRVKTGDLLARLNDTNLQAAVRTAQANVASKQAALDKLKAGAKASDLAAANAAVKDAQTALQNAQYNLTVTQNSSTVNQTVRDREYEAAFYEANYGDYLNKYKAGKIDKLRLDQEWNNLMTAKERLATARTQATLSMSEANQRVASAQETLRKAQASLAELKAGAGDTDLKAADAALQSAQSELEQAQVNLAGSTLIAPFDGIVLEVLVKEGAVVATGTNIVHLYDPQTVQARVTMTEEDYPLARAGATAQVYLDSQPDVVITGTVSYIVPLRDASSTSPVYPAYIELDHVPDTVAPGMTVDGSILIAKRSNALRLPRALVHARSDGTAEVQVWANGTTETHKCKTGLRGDQYVEVLSGVSEGERVVSQ